MEKVYGYEAPQVEIIEVEVEKGFAASPGGSLEGPFGNGGSGEF